MTDTTPTANELLLRIAAASQAGKVEELRDLVTKLPVPTPPPSTLRIIDLAKCRSRTEYGIWETKNTAVFDPVYIDHIASQSDPMTLIERVVKKWWTESNTNADVLISSIRAALEGDSQ